MYQVLYRKWRPKTFDEVTGQEHITKTLSNQIKNGRFGHAYLFTGSRGTGKTTCAKIFARAVNCLHPRGGNPCGECENCLAAENGSSVDIVEMDAASNRGIDDIREIIEQSAFAPASSGYRVYIIDEVHMLTKEASNALLKTLEEPPEHIIFILATTEADSILPTIRSRCQRFDFNRIRPEDIAARLEYVAEKESVKISRDAAMLIAAVADGALRDALSLLDRCIGFSSDIDLAVVREAAGLAKKEYIFELASACVNKNCAKALEITDRLYNESKSMHRLSVELTSHFRSLMLIKTIKEPRRVIFMTDEEFEAAVSQCDRLSLSDIIYCMDVLARAQERMNKGSDNRTELEAALVRLCSPELDFSNEALLARISALEKQINRLSAGAPLINQTPQTDSDDALTSKNPPSSDNKSADDNSGAALTPVTSEFTALREPVSSSASKEKPQPEQKPPAAPAEARQSVNHDELVKNAVRFDRWPEIIDAIALYSKTIASALKGSTAYTSGNFLLIDTDNEMAYELLKSSAQKNSIRRAVYEMTGVRYNMGPYRKKQERKTTDPLDAFIANASADGISVTEL